MLAGWVPGPELREQVRQISTCSPENHGTATIDRELLGGIGVAQDGPDNGYCDAPNEIGRS